jgi:cell division protein FtsI/penicillin-binding protein 2/beta-lactamase regulating signal transducer with metallopeptidase domain
MTEVFHALTQSEFTHRAALTLAHSLWQGLLVAVLLAIALRWLKLATAGRRYVVACLALLALLAMPIVTFWRLETSLPPVENVRFLGAGTEPQLHVRGVELASAAAVAADENTSMTDAGASATPSAIPWQTWTVALWLVGMMALTLWHGLGWVSLQCLRRRGVSQWTGDFAALASRLSKRLRLRAIPQIIWSTRIAGPVAFGCWRSVVLMPASMATGFTMTQIEMILAHEFAHLRRHDYSINLCQTAMTTLFFFHPAVWWINHVIRREREHACDDLAIATVGDTVGYARALAALAEQELTGPPDLAPAAVSGRSALRHRIERLLRPPPSRPALRFWPGLAALVVAVLGWQTLPSPSQDVRAMEAANGEAALRGDIRDRNGVLLATNDKEDVQIWFQLRDVALAYVEAHGGTFPRRKRGTYGIIQQTNGKPRLEDREFPDIEAMFQELVIPRLNAASLPQLIDPEREKFSETITKNNHAALVQPYNSTGLRSCYEGDEGLPAGVTPEQASAVLAKYGNELWCYRKGLTPNEEKRARAIAGQVPGMSVHIKKWRHYPFGALAGHVLGYVTLHWPPSGKGRPEDEVGVFGVEKTQDAKLRATSAGDGKGPSRGSDIYLTLDARHQTVVEQTLRDGQLGRAAAVLMEVDTGDVLAMASVPSYDPNDFVPSITREKFDEYNSNETRPLLNRAVRAFTPGSTFMVATSLAAICSLHEEDTFTCAGGLRLRNKYMPCWIGQKGGSHGALNMRQAIGASCGPYFFQLGNAVGNEAMNETMALCGFGHRTRIELAEEVNGILPLRTWWTANCPKEAFTEATIANISIGQGAVEATPLQLADLMATVGNGGTVWKPRLVDRIAPSGDASKAEELPRVRRADLREHGLTQSGLEALHGALEDVVQSPHGTAKAAQSPALRIAGITGTAQNWRMDKGEAVRDNLAWFICYAPAEKPRWALAVLVQGGKGGGISAAPIARHILEQICAIESGTLKVEPQPMAPVKGNFDTVDTVVLPSLKRTE